MSTATVTNKAIRTLTVIRAEDLNDALKVAKMPLREAADAWLETRRPFLGKRTARDYSRDVDILVRHFGNVPLEQLANPDLLRAYQVEGSKTCTATTVNHELGMVVQLLKRIRRWDDIKPHYEQLPLPKESPGRALTPEEENSPASGWCIQSQMGQSLQPDDSFDQHGCRSFGDDESSLS